MCVCHLLKKTPNGLGDVSSVENVVERLLLLVVEVDPVVVGVDREQSLLAQLEAPVGERVPNLGQGRRLVDRLK